MATQINNSASATYGYGRDGQDSAISNIATTNLIDEFAIFGSKTATKLSFRPGENIPYQIYVRNDGTSSLFNVTIIDDLGGIDNPLSFVSGTATLNINGTNTSIAPTSINPLTFIIPLSLSAGDQATISFLTRVNSSLAETIESITNTASITANEGSTTGNIISVNPSPTSTITLEDFASIEIIKNVSSNEIVPRQTFSYTLLLENSGNLNANGVIITDILPVGFSISSISSITNGTEINYNSSDYSVDTSTNTLTLPSSSGPEIIVPSAENGLSGTTLITITGSIN